MSKEGFHRITHPAEPATQLAALREGNESVFDAIFRQYYPALCRYAQRIVGGDPDDAEEVVQQVFVKLWEQREQIEIKWTLKAYLYKMVHNRSLNWVRDHQNRTKPLEPETEMGQAPSVTDRLHAADIQKAVQRALNQLPPQCRKIFELSRFEELKYREIADHLGLSLKTVEVQMGKALRLMRMQLSDFLAWAFLVTAMAYYQKFIQLIEQFFMA